MAFSSGGFMSPIAASRVEKRRRAEKGFRFAMYGTHIGLGDTGVGRPINDWNNNKPCPTYICP